MQESWFKPESCEAQSAPTRTRLEYGAVPLRPMQAVYPDESVQDSYLSASMHHIEEKLHANFQAARISLGLPGYQYAALEDFLQMSLFEAQISRVNHNDHWSFPEHFDEDGEIESAALAGTATPSELLQLLMRYPELESIELAKLSHPFDFSETAEMEQAVRKAIEEADGEILRGRKGTYKLKRDDAALMAMIIVRKQVVGHVQSDQGALEVVERRSLLTLDMPSNGRIMQYYFVDNGMSEESFGAITTAIERRLSRGDLDDTGWLFPTTTSYYLRRRPNKSD